KTFNSISDSVALTNSHFDIISANNSFFEQSLPHPTSQNLFEVFFAEAKNQLPENIYHMDTIQFSILLNGNVKHYYLRKHKIPLQHSSEFIFMILIRDVTSQKQLENQVLESSKLAELGTIGSSIAHELNNPLGGILSFAQLIKMDLDKDDPFYKDIDLIEVSALKCKDIIENLLGFSRTSEEGENQSYSLEETIQKAIKIVNLQTASKNIQIDFISHSDEYLEHKGNQNQMVQALCNILQNSIDAFDEQKKTSSALTQNIRIEVKGGHKNQITITDNGPGIPAKVRSKIFNPLFSTKKSKTKSGLGLTVSYQIVKNQGGHLEVFSQPKAGTSVRITL
ncbi:MAG: HAMP domain-containing histidine kinase, partial [Bdellovibrionales bacterium]|nr:HAMP domain-containing histidine kinase [Bdellovibrionales bacterium]